MPIPLLVVFLASALVVAGCSGDAEVSDAGPALDAPAAMDAFVTVDAWSSPADANLPDGTIADAPADAPEPPLGCGWSDADGTFACGGADTLPASCTAGARCCVGKCAPGGSEEVCCDPVTGVIEIYRYSGGDCPLDETTACD